MRQTRVWDKPCANAPSTGRPRYRDSTSPVRMSRRGVRPVAPIQRSVPLRRPTAHRLPQRGSAPCPGSRTTPRNCGGRGNVRFGKRATAGSLASVPRPACRRSSPASHRYRHRKSPPAARPAVCAAGCRRRSHCRAHPACPECRHSTTGDPAHTPFSTPIGTAARHAAAAASSGPHTPHREDLVADRKSLADDHQRLSNLQFSVLADRACRTRVGANRPTRKPRTPMSRCLAATRNRNRVRTRRTARLPYRYQCRSKVHPRPGGGNDGDYRPRSMRNSWREPEEFGGENLLQSTWTSPRHVGNSSQHNNTLKSLPVKPPLERALRNQVPGSCKPRKLPKPHRTTHIACFNTPESRFDVPGFCSVCDG